jgi:hypothetical protein
MQKDFCNSIRYKADVDYPQAAHLADGCSPCFCSLQWGLILPREAIVLDDENGARLARIVLGPGNGPDVAAPHSSPQSDTASMNA